MSMTSESDEKLMTTNAMDSPSTDEANSGGANAGNHGPLKKGPWTSAEDAILIEYVTKHGEGNWNAVQKHSGLARCGKSCRLRWANHLRPDLKKGAFTPEEEQRIIELHAKMGNKWARMAAELPGRTDNEIKNFWNTRIKRRQRAGLPIYPSDISLQSLPNENNPHNNDDPISLSPPDGPHQTHRLPVTSFIKIPSVDFEGLELNHHPYLYPPRPLLNIDPSVCGPPSPHFLDIPSSCGGGLLLLPPGLDPFHQHKRPRGPEPLFPGLSPSTHIGSSLYHHPSLLCPRYEHDSTLHNVELPSLQTQTGNGPLPFFEAVDDVLIQTPPDDRWPACSSGLLEDILYGSEALRNTGNGGNTFLGLQAGGSSLDSVEDSGSDLIGGTHWEGYDKQISPLGGSPSSVFSESGPITPSSLDEPRLPENNLPVKEAASNLNPIQYVDTANPMILSRPDYLLASSCLAPIRCPVTNDHSLLENAMGKLLGDDLRQDCKQMDTGPSPSTQGHGLNSCAWNPLPTV